MKHRLFFTAAAVFAFVAGMAAVVLVNTYLKTAKIVVANRDIDANVVITHKDVRRETVSARMAGRGVLCDPVDAVGKVTDRPLPEGTPLAAKFLGAPSAAGASGRLLAYSGTVAVPLPANSETTVGGSVKPGDKVTVYALYKAGSAGAPVQASGVPKGSVVELAVDVPVLGVPSAGPAGGSPSGAVVLAATPEQSARVLAAQAGGAGIACVLLPAGKEE